MCAFVFRFDALLDDGSARGDASSARGLPAGAAAALPHGIVPGGGQLLAVRPLPPSRLRAAAAGAAAAAGRGRRLSGRRPRRPAERHPAAVARLHAAAQLGRPAPLRLRRHLTVSRSLGVRAKRSGPDFTIQRVLSLDGWWCARTPFSSTHTNVVSYFLSSPHGRKFN